MTESISKDTKDSNKSRFFTVTAAEYRILEKIWEKNHQKLETPSPKAKSKNHTFVQFRALLHKLLSYLSGLVDQATFS
jgi:hypothetical protein